MRLLLPASFDRFDELLAEAVYFELPELADAVRERQLTRWCRQRCARSQSELSRAATPTTTEAGGIAGAVNHCRTAPLSSINQCHERQRVESAEDK